MRRGGEIPVSWELTARLGAKPRCEFPQPPRADDLLRHGKFEHHFSGKWFFLLLEDGLRAVFLLTENLATDPSDQSFLFLLDHFDGIPDGWGPGIGELTCEVGSDFRADIFVVARLEHIVIAADDADLVGDALNTAARLEAACAPGRVLVGEDTWRLTRSTIKYEVLGEVTVKGKAEPVATFQVVAEAGPEDESATPFIGRDIELTQLVDLLDEARTERSVKLATLIGAPGVGKTRLAEELARREEGDVTAFDLRCERSGQLIKCGNNI